MTRPNPDLAGMAAVRLAWLVVATAGAVARGQIDTRALERVDEAGPLAPGWTDLRVDLRATTGFDGLYRLPRHHAGTAFFGAFGRNGWDRGVGGQRRYALVEGGLVAVFPRSGLSLDDPFSAVPAGTVYTIGALPPGLGKAFASRPRVPAFNKVSLSASRSIRPKPAAAGVTTVHGEPSASILTDEAFRKRRVAHLLRKAAEAGKQSGRR